ncbi:MAG: encapsulin, partial [Firmicutes bacterium]|nr:encapsulin [Bacillota bacterium]
ELEQVEKIARAVVYQTPALPDQVVVVLSVGAENVDLALGLEMTVAYLDVEGMDHLFRVLESAVPRIKRPQAILTIEA